MKNIIKKAIQKSLFLDSISSKLRLFLSKDHYIKDSQQYWIERYKAGGNSGVGSYNKFAAFKADVINEFVKKNRIDKAIEFGCGDGNQLQYLKINEYIGFDISLVAIDLCKERFKKDNSKSFKMINNYHNQKADLVLSLDVIFHLIEDPVFDNYMKKVFQAADKYVIIFSSNTATLNSKTSPHVKHREFTNWIKINEPEFRLLQVIPNKYPYKGNYLEGSFSDFYLYEKRIDN